jgi:hypothetical protein
LLNAPKEVVLPLLALLTSYLLVRALSHTEGPLQVLDHPNQGDFLFDQTPEFDATEAEPVPDLVFDQSLPEEFTDWGNRRGDSPTRRRAARSCLPLGLHPPIRASPPTHPVYPSTVSALWAQR